MIYPQACRELWKNKKEKQAGLSPDPGRPYILAECMLASCQRVICELRAASTEGALEHFF